MTRFVATGALLLATAVYVQLHPPSNLAVGRGWLAACPATFGPWNGTEFYANVGTGFHSNDARGMTITRDSEGNPVDRVTPLVRANGAEVGVRTVAIPHLQSTVSLWTLRPASELVYNGDVQYPAWSRDGSLLAVGVSIRSSLWRFQPQKRAAS